VLTLGFGLVLFIPWALVINSGCVIWSAVAANEFNARLRSQSQIRIT
jgi:hypothetical protein